MALKRRLQAIVSAIALAGLCTSPAWGSGDYGAYPWYLDAWGGGAADLKPMYDGRVGVVMARSGSSLLFLKWRLLHGLKVGQDVGPRLTAWCCEGLPDNESIGEDPVHIWIAARKQVAGTPPLSSNYNFEYIQTDRAAPDYSWIPNCFEDAFATATATLQDRIARYGAASPAVVAWLAGQDAVFKACGAPGVVLPALPADTPGWLKADRAYQEAALALYNGDNDGAAQRFAAIGRDHASPWAPRSLYLQARARQRQAFLARSPQTFGLARAAIGRLNAAPAGTYGQEEAAGMLQALDYREQPAALMARLDRKMNAPEPAADLDVDLSDYLGLSDAAAKVNGAVPDAADWVRTIAAHPKYDETITGNGQVAAAFAHALARWRAGHDVAWLIAALALADARGADAPTLAADAEAVPADDPGWLSVRYQLVRLTIGSAPAAVTRARLDAILARDDLSANDRYLFMGERLQVASGPAEFVRLGLRRHICQASKDNQDPKFSACGKVGALYDDALPTGFSQEALAIIDRMPLSTRMDLLNPRRAIPAPVRLDIALTSYARAFQLQDDRAIDRLAGELAVLLPQMKADWRRIAATPHGPDKLFAETFALSKIPGARSDLVGYDLMYGYVRPRGAVRAFQGYWADWMLFTPGRPGAAQRFMPLQSYQTDGMAYGDGQHPATDADGDLTCLGECGAAAFPFHPPAFAAAGQAQAARERAYFVGGWDDPLQFYTSQPQPPVPAGARSAWEEMFAYVKAHPHDPRAPESLHWLIHITHWGVNRDHLSLRAFQLMNSRYPNDPWTQRTPYNYG